MAFETVAVEKAQAVADVAVQRYGTAYKVYNEGQNYSFTKTEDGNYEVSGNGGVGVFSPIEFGLKFTIVETTEDRYVYDDDADDEGEEDEDCGEPDCPICGDDY